MPNGFKYLSTVNECDCQSNGGSPTTVTYINQCGLTTTISCPVSPNVSFSFYAVQITNSTGSNVQILNSPVLINQASPFGLNGPDVGMDNNTIKDNLMVFAINNRAYGPTTETGYYAGIDPPTSGYTVYSMRSGCSAYNVQTANNDATLIGIVNSYGAGAVSIYTALDWAVDHKNGEMATLIQQHGGKLNQSKESLDKVLQQYLNTTKIIFILFISRWKSDQNFFEQIPRDVLLIIAQKLWI